MTLHVVLPLVQPELIVYAGTVHEPTVEPPDGAATRFSVAVLLNAAVHVPDATPPVLVQFNWVASVGVDVLVTAPLPVPENAIVTFLLSVKAPFCITPDVRPVTV